MRLREKALSLDRKKVIQLIGFILFMVILFRVFCSATYLFRNTGYDRTHIVGLEKEDPAVDMVYIGGSAAFVYWQALKAWNDCGFTSYSYATNSILAESIRAYLEEAKKCQNPELFVVGLRAFQYYSDNEAEAGLRNGSDSMDLTSVSRYKLLYSYFKNRTISEETDVLSYYFDIIKYHTNTGNLGSSLAWGLLNNNGTSVNKGWEWIDSYAYLDEPADYRTEERAELLENDETILRDLLSYCQKEKLNVLFVVCPYYITEADWAKYNTMEDIIESYGFDFLNANAYYEEMGIDFSTDFYNKNHVNLFGAKKYTEFLENYILEHYNMPDHRGDESYALWDEDYERFLQEEDEHAATVTGLRLNVEKGLELAEQMKQAENLSEWYELAEDDRYTLLIATSGRTEYPQSISGQNMISGWSLEQSSVNQIRVIKGDSILYTNETDQALVTEGTAGIWDDTLYRISVENNSCSITVNGEEFSAGQEGMNIVVFDNNYRRVVDAITLSCNEQGKLEIHRE